MTTLAIKGAGTTIKLGLVTVAEITTIGGVGTTAPEEDATHLQSTQVDFIAGLPESPQVEFSGNWIGGNTEQAALRDGVGGAAQAMTVVWPDGTTVDFDFVPLGFSLGETTATGVLKCTFNGRMNDLVWT